MPKPPKFDAKSFIRWTSIYFAGWAACQTVFLGLVALALDLRIRSMGLPYVLLVSCGYVGGVLIFWARHSSDQPKSRAIRFALAIFLFMNTYLGVLVFGAFRVGLLSQIAAVYDYGPYVLPGSVLTSIVV